MSLSQATSFIDDLTICSICQSTLHQPVACLSCENAFCLSCIQQWLSSQSTAPCPFGCPPPFVERRCPPILLSLLSKLTLQCKYASVGCPLSVPYDTIDKHEQIDCEYATIECTWCHRTTARRTMDTHLNEECDAILIKCQQCPMVTTRKEMKDNHQQVDCLQLQLQSTQQRILALERMVDFSYEMTKITTTMLNDMKQEIDKLKSNQFRVSSKSMFYCLFLAWKVGQTIVFYDLPGASLTTGPMPLEYAQLKWRNASYLHKSFALSQYRKSGFRYAFDHPMVGNYIVCGDGSHPMTISSANASIPFDVKSLVVYSAYNTKLVMIATGWRNGTQLYKKQGLVGSCNETWRITLKWENIDTIMITAKDGHAEGGLCEHDTQFALVLIAMS
jgi:hypothetical protein